MFIGLILRIFVVCGSLAQYPPLPPSRFSNIVTWSMPRKRYCSFREGIARLLPQESKLWLAMYLVGIFRFYGDHSAGEPVGRKKPGQFREKWGRPDLHASTMRSTNTHWVLSSEFLSPPHLAPLLSHSVGYRQAGTRRKHVYRRICIVGSSRRETGIKSGSYLRNKKSSSTKWISHRECVESAKIDLWRNAKKYWKS